MVSYIVKPLKFNGFYLLLQMKNAEELNNKHNIE